MSSTHRSSICTTAACAWQQHITSARIHGNRREHSSIHAFTASTAAEHIGVEAAAQSGGCQGIQRKEKR